MAITYQTLLPVLFVHLICKAYIASLVWVSYSGFVYILSDLYEEEYYRNIRKGCTCISGLATVVIFVLPIQIYHEGREIFTYGAATIATYIFALFFILLTIGFCLIKGDKMISRKRVAALIWMVIWLIAAAIQFFNSHLLLVGFASCIGITIIFLKFENPDSTYDRVYECYNATTMHAYLCQCYKRRQNVSILLISMSLHQVNEQEMQRIDFALHKLVAFLNTVPSVKVFKSVDQDIVVVFPDMSSMTEVYQQIQDRFYADYFYTEHNDKYLPDHSEFPNTMFVLIPESTIALNTEEVLHIFQYLKVLNHENNTTNVFYVNEAILNEIREKEIIREEIIRALEEDRVEVFYQPIFGTEEEKIVSAEALVRLRQEDGSLMSPVRFVPIAEQSGLIRYLGERVFEKTCQFIANTDMTSMGLHYIEVNLSVVQCNDKELARRYISIMEKYNVSPQYINLEITETVFSSTKRILLSNMRQLMKYGVTFSLDDFGNGQSNLDYVIDMPVQIMKFDMFMTQEYFRSDKARFVMLAAINMAHDLKLQVVAEGVETKEQLKEMKKNGVDYIQGYYFSKPLPQEEFCSFVNSFNHGNPAFVDKYLSNV